MANKVTGKTDTTGALSISPNTPKSVMLIGKNMTEDTGTDTVEKNKIFSIQTTGDAVQKFGEKSPMCDAVRVLVKGGVNYINGIVIDMPKKTDQSDKEYEKSITSAYDEALSVSLDEETVKMIILDTNKQIPSLKEHMAYAEENDMFRYSVVMPDNGVNDQTSLVNFAKSIDYSRIFTSGPAMVDTNAELADPVVAAAALGAVIMTETDDPALPLDGVQIKGLGGVSRRIMKEEKDILGNSGVTPLYYDGSSPTIHRLVTTCISDKAYQEGTVRFIADYVLELVENTLRQNYKRTKNVDRILGDTGIRGTVKTVLKKMEDLEIIRDFDESTLTVIRDPNDLYGALVDYEINVVTPLYTITITQHLKL